MWGNYAELSGWVVVFYDMVTDVNLLSYRPLICLSFLFRQSADVDLAIYHVRNNLSLANESISPSPSPGVSFYKLVRDRIWNKATGGLSLHS